MTTATAEDFADDSVKTATPSERTKRRKTPLIVGSLIVAALAVSGGYAWATAGTESTDDAQVEGRVMNVASRITGQVLHVRVEDNQVVNPGDVLVELDPADNAAKVAAAKADLSAARASSNAAKAALALTEKTAPANLIQAQGGVTTATSSAMSARTAIDQAKAEVASAESRKSLAELNLRRSKALLSDNAVAPSDADAHQNDFDDANAQLDRARARLASAEAAFTGSGGSVLLAQGRLTAASTTADQIDAAKAAVALADARVEQAQAALDLAELNLSYTTVKATRRGVVSRRTVEEGQVVGPDRQLFAIVPTDDVWVVANFKEDQLAEMHAGQPVSIELDTYGRRKFTGKVESIAGGTGARFALLPPDNATGNFVKVVQRVPVLIRFDGSPGVDLRPGMSADVTVRTGK
jgi:membrane fusion protein (multidrug efflux system)